MGWFGPQSGDCSCCYTPNPACLGLTGSWADTSGTWSTSSDAFWDYITCTSAGVRTYTPTSGLSAGERMGVQFYINGSSEFVCGFFFDAEDKDNCHRIRITRTATTVSVALESVVSGSSSTVYEWDTPVTRINGASFDAFRVSLGEFEKQCIVSLVDVFGDLGADINTFFPLDATYSKFGNGNKFGLFVDSFSGSQVNFYIETGQFKSGRVNCAEPEGSICASSYAVSTFARHDLGDSVQLDFNIIGYSSEDDCSGYDFTSQTLDWSNSVSAFPDGCGYDAPNSTCTPDSMNDDWVQTTKVEIRPTGDTGDFREKELVLYAETVINRGGSNPGAMRAEFSKRIKIAEMVTGNNVTLPNTFFSASGDAPFSGEWSSVTVTFL